MIVQSLMFYIFFFHQRQAKYSENKLKSIKARNEYLLTLEATNSSVFKYYIHDLSDLIDVSNGEVQLQCHRLLKMLCIAWPIERSAFDLFAKGRNECCCRIYGLTFAFSFFYPLWSSNINTLNRSCATNVSDCA